MKLTRRRGGKTKVSWCTQKVANKYLKDEKKCEKHGCKWKPEWIVGRKTKTIDAHCKKISTMERAERENKKSYCGKFPATKKACPKSKCRFVDMGSGGEWCLDKKHGGKKRKTKRKRKGKRRTFRKRYRV